MQPKSASWWAALAMPNVEWHYGIDILAADEATPLEDPLVYDMNASDRMVPSSATVTLDVHAKTHRSFAITLRNNDGRYLVGVAGQPSGGVGSPIATGLTWFSVRYRPWVDLMTGYDPVTSAKLYDRTYLGIYVLVTPEAQIKHDSRVVALTMLDKSILLCKPNLATATNLPTHVINGHTVGGYAAGSTVDSAMLDLAARGGVPAARCNFEPSSATLPSDFPVAEGSEWWTHLQALAASISSALYFDARGYLVRRADPLTIYTASVYTFTPGAAAIYTQMTRKTDLASTYNHMIVIGGSSTKSTVRGEAQVTDPASPYHRNAIGDRIVYVGKDGRLNDRRPDPLIGSVAQATTRAQQLLARHIGQQEIFTLAGRSIPAIEPYDRLTMSDPAAGANLDVSIDRISWQLAHPAGGGMTVECSRWFQIGS